MVLLLIAFWSVATMPLERANVEGLKQPGERQWWASQGDMGLSWGIKAKAAARDRPLSQN